MGYFIQQLKNNICTPIIAKLSRVGDVARVKD